MLAVIAIAIVTFLVWGLFGPEPRWTYAIVNAVVGADHRLSLRARALPHRCRSWSRPAGRRRRGAVPRRRGDRAAAHDRHAGRRQDRHAHGGPARVPRRASRPTAGSPDEVLRLAASLDQGSEHPLAAGDRRRSASDAGWRCRPSGGVRVGDRHRRARHGRRARPRARQHGADARGRRDMARSGDDGASACGATARA